MEQQWGALLQAQQMKQQNMLELMNHFASEKSDKSEKKKMEQLDWRALFSLRKHREGPGCDLRSSDPKARSVAGHER